MILGIYHGVIWSIHSRHPLGHVQVLCTYYSFTRQESPFISAVSDISVV